MDLSVDCNHSEDDFSPEKQSHKNTNAGTKNVVGT